MKFTQIRLIIGTSIIGRWLGHSMGSQENGAGAAVGESFFWGHGEFTSNLSGYNLNVPMVIFLSTKQGPSEGKRYFFLRHSCTCKNHNRNNCCHLQSFDHGTFLIPQVMMKYYEYGQRLFENPNLSRSQLCKLSNLTMIVFDVSRKK